MARQHYFQKRFVEELARRSEPGTMGFIFTVILLMGASYFVVPWWPGGLFVGLAIIVTNLIRFRYCRAFLNQKLSQVAFLRLAITLIILNGALWNFFFITAYLHDRMLGIASIISLLATSGFSAGATTSLFASRIAQLSFQCMLLLPLLATLTYFGITTGSADYWIIAGMCFAFFFFNFKATQSYRAHVIDLFIREYELIETRQRLAEEQEKMIHSSRLASLGEMAGGLAHEINNPLAILMLGLDAIESPPGNTDIEAFRKGKQTTMRRAVERISKIVRGLRQFSQQGDSLPFETVSLRLIVDETLEFFLGRLRNQQIEHRIQGDLDLKIHARPVQISQVLLNLLANSLDAVTKIDKKSILIDVRKEGSEVWIEVRDSGPGLDPEIKERLFQPFATSKLPGQGMGLGLSISRGIMREHGGDLVYLNNHPETTFRMVLPAN